MKKISPPSTMVKKGVFFFSLTLCLVLVCYVMLLFFCFTGEVREGSRRKQKTINQIPSSPKELKAFTVDNTI